MSLSGTMRERARVCTVAVYFYLRVFHRKCIHGPGSLTPLERIPGLPLAGLCFYVSEIFPFTHVLTFLLRPILFQKNVTVGSDQVPFTVRLIRQFHTAVLSTYCDEPPMILHLWFDMVLSTVFNYSAVQ